MLKLQGNDFVINSNIFWKVGCVADLNVYSVCIVYNDLQKKKSKILIRRHYNELRFVLGTVAKLWSTLVIRYSSVYMVSWTFYHQGCLNSTSCKSTLSTICGGIPINGGDHLFCDLYIRSMGSGLCSSSIYGCKYLLFTESVLWNPANPIN